MRRRAARVGAAVALVLALAAPGRAAAACDGALATKVIPLPVYATLPNEGNTFGAMPVFLSVCPQDQRTASIIAPSVTWNDVIHVTGTFRWYDYPSDDTAMTLILSASTRVNFNGLLLWQRTPRETGSWTDELTVRLQRSVFFRFFGIGPDTPASAETSYTGVRAFATGRRGLVVAPHLDVGLTLGLERDEVQEIGVPGLPLAPAVFPDAPGMEGATTAWQGLDLRYDDRHGGDYAESGVRAEASVAVVEGLAGSPTFARGAFQVRGVVPEWDRVSGAARVAWTGVTSAGAPFYKQSTLGGAFLLRGFTEDRFIDRQAWTVELEQRVRVLTTRIFGVVADWRVDPFVAVGQVFGSFDRMFSHPQVAGGAGFRAYVHPNVLGRVDVGAGGEGLKVYVELGYPF